MISFEWLLRKEIVVLNHYFVRHTTVDRIRASWIGEGIERYVVWLTEQHYAARNVSFRVSVLVRFGEFARTSGANELDDLPAYVEPFIVDWLNHRKREYSEFQRSVAARELRNPIRQMLRLVLPNLGNDTRSAPDPFTAVAPGFFDFLRRERAYVRAQSSNTDTICNDFKTTCKDSVNRYCPLCRR